MAILKTFRGIRPQKKYVKEIASKPYDVLNEKEARMECKGNPLSFYHVIKPEIDFPDDHDHYAADVYKKGAANFQKLMDDGIFFRDDADYYYIYAQTMNGKRQYGIVGCAAIDDYFNNVIRKHELTRPDKEEDRKNHIRYSKVNNEPVFFAYRADKELDNLVGEIIKNEPEYDFTADDGIGHTFWISKDTITNDKITAAFAKMPATYVADGHHRTAAAALVGKEMRDQNKSHTGKEEYNYFLAVHFPDDQLTIMDYNRVVRDLNGLSSEEFLKKIQTGFEMEVIGKKQYRPQSLHEFGMYFENQWYKLKAKPGSYDDNDPIGVLDVTILSKQILEPILNIKDLRTDKRIEFVGGLRGLGELERRVNSGEMQVAFSMFPVTMKQLIDIADNNLIMPPKVTWFEPKLRSGIIVHDLKK
jgi:uncharacterized protein (DUF1015 family)